MPEIRWKNGKGYKDNEYFTSAIEKYGWQNFKHEIIENDLDEESACEKEKMYISKYKSMDKRYGYNILSGGNLTPDRSGSVATKETREKMSAKRKGRKFSEEHKSKISNALKGKKHTEEQRIKNIESLSRGWGKNKGDNNGMYNKHGAEHPASKHILQYTKSGDLIGEFESAREAVVELGLSVGAYKNISACANGQKCRPAAYGYVWRFG